MENMNDTLLKRFVSYATTWTTSDLEKADAGIMPSTDRQADFARTLKNELHSIGISDVTITEHAYVCARLPATKGCEKAPVVGFLAHMDTAEEVSGENVKPNIVKNYDGSVLNIGNGIVLDPAKDAALAAAKGETVITTDGSTLLGADDKAGIAEIMTAMEALIADKDAKHGTIEIIFSPDEETGHGMDYVPTDWLTAKQCYTLDGGHVGELETECFTAYKCDVNFTGVACHTGTARGIMANAITMASAFVSMLPQNESPEATDGYYGFYAPMDMTASIENAHVLLYLRDFTMEKMQRRLDTVDIIAKAIEARFNGGKVEVVHTKQYLNMKEELDKNPAVVEKLVQAAKLAGAEPVFSPIRGGTDGSRLTEMGIPTPNIFTGGHNFHSRSEWVSLDQMNTATKLVIELAKLWAN
ncbi:MAG: peptidase T [Treponema sp.]|nr:peptidase T [Candidatus Treponema caballi]